MRQSLLNIYKKKCFGDEWCGSTLAVENQAGNLIQTSKEMALAPALVKY